MKVAYTKMHGTGNEILVVDQRNGNAPAPSPETLRKLGSSATGPGFDQLMWVEAAANSESAASDRVFNADGSEVWVSVWNRKDDLRENLAAIADTFGSQESRS